MPFSRGSSLPRDQSPVSCIVGRFFTHWVTWEAQIYIYRLITVYEVIHFVSYGNSSTIYQERHSFIHCSEVPKLLKNQVAIYVWVSLGACIFDLIV